GEGGAGLFSDGKLITRIKSSFVKYVMRKFVEFGAPAETEYTSNPHLGSNKIRTIITKISDHLKSQGHNILYNSRVDELIYEGNKVIGVLLSSGEKLFSEHIILAAGHSCQKMYEHLQENNVAMVAKSFAVGVRIEHPRREIDKIQYGEFASDELIGAARYRLSYHNNKSDKGTYSFCMCPGGHVLATSTEENSLVCNGMSNFSRSSPWSNSALVVSVTKGKDFKESEILAGLRFQQEIEEKAYSLSLKQASGKELPAITVKEFLKNRLTKEELPKTSCPSKLFKADFNEIFPEFIIDHLRVALYEFDKNMPGFSSGKSVLIAPETRTSAPVTVLRDKKSLVSTSHFGLYPCGEGAGYAGGITSAAVDGIKVAESIMESIVKNT
ncbi:MAG: putative FAD-dependent dehydrogenase, partial [Thermoproteota archaeon]